MADTTESNNNNNNNAKSDATNNGGSDEPEHFDVIVVGSGGGVKIGSPAFKLGKKTALVERGFDVFGEHKIGLGGTCLNRGCIPSKMLIHAADVADVINSSERYNVGSTIGEVAWEELITRVSENSDNTSNSISSMFSNRPRETWAYFQQNATFVGPKTLDVGDGKVITGDQIFLATGSRPRVLDIPGLEGTPYMTSTEALRQTKFPASMVVIGGGYVAVELAHFYGALGCEVHVIARSVLLRTEDRETADEFTRVFAAKYDVHLGATSVRVAYDAGESKFTYTFQDSDGAEETLVVDQILVAAGVVPNSDMGLETTGVEIDDDGFIVVNERLETTTPGIYAFGDVAGNFLFRHSANFEGAYLYRTKIFPEEPTDEAINYVGMPHAAFSHPQVAGVGETEEELVARGAEFVKGVNPYIKSAMGDALRSDSGFAKLLIERGTRRILGAFVVGHEASTLIHEVIPLMRLDGKLDDLLLCVHVHPALSEIVRNAARRAAAALKEAGDDVPLEVQIA